MPSTHLSAPGGVLLPPLLSAVLKKTWPLTLASLYLAPQLFFPCSPRWLVASTKEDPTLQPAWRCLPLASGCGQLGECCVPLAGCLPTVPTSEKCNHFESFYVFWREGFVVVVSLFLFPLRITLFIAAQERRVC